MITPEVYAHWRSSMLGSITERVEQAVVFGLAGELRGKRVLDVGTGDGSYAIAAATRGAVVTGLDADDAMIEAARRRAAARRLRVEFVHGSAAVLPFRDATFDVVLAVTVLCFVGDARAAVEEMARVLAPGGRLVLADLAGCSVWAAERRVRGWLGASMWRRTRFWSVRELVELARQAGLNVVGRRGAVYFPPIGLAARVLAPVEPLLTRLRAPGAAFLAIAADRSCAA